MNPVEITQGKSFKGLSAYLLQDENRETSERVGWSDTRNLAGADPDQAWRLMLATANSAGALKAGQTRQEHGLPLLDQLQPRG